MSRHALETRPRTPGRPRPFSRAAFAVWAAAFAVGVLSHEWQAAESALSVHALVAVAAVAVLLRPTSVPRLAGLFALLAVELLTALPNPWNHLLLIGVVGGAFVAWWAVLAVRSPAAARDPGVVFDRAAPYLRLAFLLSWVFAAFAKLNTGFLDTVATCSVWVLEGIPGVQVPPDLNPALIAGTLALELSIPVLLFFHRTRPYAVVLGFGFHLVSALGGHAAFTGLAWSFYLLFLPPAVLARVVVTARRAAPRAAVATLGRAARSPLPPVAAGVLFALGVAWVQHVLPVELERLARNGGSAVLCIVWLGAWGLLLARLWRRWIPARGPRASLRVRNAVLLLGLGALVATALMPYVGLKTRAAFTMYSNLRTEPGYWNHLVVPEAARVFGWQDGEVRFVDTDDDGLRRRIEDLPDARTVLGHARRIVAGYHDAEVVYDLDGRRRLADPVAEDPVLGAPVSLLQRALGAFRPFVDAGTCQH